MAPRQAAAWVALGAGRQRREFTAQLVIARMAAHGERDAITKQLREWDD